MSDKPVICICGGGNGAHVATGLAAANSRGFEVRVLTLFMDEADRWTQKLKESDMTIVKHHRSGEKEEIKAKPSLVTKDPSKAIPGANVLLFCVPAFAHQQYFTAVAPYVTANTAIIGMPGQPGFEFQCFHILKDMAKSCVIFNYETLPWACRIAEFGRKVELLGTKETLTGSRLKGVNYKQPGAEDPAKLLQSLLGALPVLKEADNFVELTIMAMTFAHPPFMYSQWKDWDGKPLKEKPAFYQGVSEEGAKLLSTMSDEVMAIGTAICKINPKLKMDNVESAESWLKSNYVKDISDPSTLYTALRTNKSYNGLVHPMKEEGGGFVPDFKYRYLSEDVPFGLTVVKGLAQIVGVATPVTDEILLWSQKQLGKKYLEGSELKGKDVGETRAPQAFGFKTLDDLMALM